MFFPVKRGNVRKLSVGTNFVKICAIKGLEENRESLGKKWKRETSATKSVINSNNAKGYQLLLVDIEVVKR